MRACIRAISLRLEDIVTVPASESAPVQLPEAIKVTVELLLLDPEHEWSDEEAVKFLDDHLERVVRWLIFERPKHKGKGDAYVPYARLAVRLVHQVTYCHPNPFKHLNTLFELVIAYDVEECLWSWCEECSDQKIEKLRQDAFWRAAETLFFRGYEDTITARRVRVAQYLASATNTFPYSTNYPWRLIDHWLRRGAELLLQLEDVKRELNSLPENHADARELKGELMELQQALRLIPLPTLSVD